MGHPVPLKQLILYKLALADKKAVQISPYYPRLQDRSEDRVNCLALGQFPVTIYNPGATWDSVDSGDVLLVQVQVRDSNGISKLP